MIIYKATNKINQKIYIGKTSHSLLHRRSKHFCNRFQKRVKNCYFTRAIVKHGFDNFVWEEIDRADSPEELNYLEKYWIQFYRSNDRKYGYNLTIGGEGISGFKHTEKTKLLISLGNKGKLIGSKNPNFNSATMTTAQRLAISITKKKQNLTRRIINHSTEVREKIKKANYDLLLKGELGRKKAIFCIESNIQYPSVSQAARDIGFSKGLLIRILKSKKTCPNGFHWEYVKEQNG